MQLKGILAAKKLLVISVVAWYVSFMEPWWTLKPFGSALIDYARADGEVHLIPDWVEDALIGASDRTGCGIPWTHWSVVGFLFHLAYAVMLGRVVWAVRGDLDLPRPRPVHSILLIGPLALSYGTNLISSVATAPHYPIPWIGGWACIASAVTLMLAWRCVWRGTPRASEKAEIEGGSPGKTSQGTEGNGTGGGW